MPSKGTKEEEIKILSKNLLEKRLAKKRGGRALWVEKFVLGKFFFQWSNLTRTGLVGLAGLPNINGTNQKKFLKKSQT